MTAKFTATLIGSIVTAICFSTILGPVFPVALFLPIGSLIPSVLLELFFQEIIGITHPYTLALTVLIAEIVLLIALSFWYFRKLIVDKQQRNNFNKRRLILYFVFLQFIIHPIGFYTWEMMNSFNIDDGQSFFVIMETVPYSGLSFVFIGGLVDLIRTKKQI